MALLRPIETIESRLSEITIKQGQLIFCTDTNNIYLDNCDNCRVHMADILKLKSESDRKIMIAPLIGKIYLVEETNKFYKYNGSDWETISVDISINADKVPYTDLVPCTLEKKNKAYAPKTLGSVVYLQDGKTVNDTITELKEQMAIQPALTTLKKTVVIDEDTNTVSIGINNFNKTTDILFVYVNSTYIEVDQDYTIVDDNTIQKSNGVWEATTDKTTFNFVVIKLTKVQTVSREKQIELDKIAELTEKVNSYESTISLLLDKISSLEKRLDNDFN